MFHINTGLRFIIFIIIALFIVILIKSKSKRIREMEVLSIKNEELSGGNQDTFLNYYLIQHGERCQTTQYNDEWFASNNSRHLYTTLPSNIRLVQLCKMADTKGFALGTRKLLMEYNHISLDKFIDIIKINDYKMNSDLDAEMCVSSGNIDKYDKYLDLKLASDSILNIQHDSDSDSPTGTRVDGITKLPVSKTYDILESLPGIDLLKHAYDDTDDYKEEINRKIKGTDKFILWDDISRRQSIHKFMDEGFNTDWKTEKIRLSSIISKLSADHPDKFITIFLVTCSENMNQRKEYTLPILRYYNEYEQEDLRKFYFSIRNLEDNPQIYKPQLRREVSSQVSSRGSW